MTAVWFIIGGVVLFLLAFVFCACKLAGDVDQAQEDVFGVDRARRS